MHFRDFDLWTKFIDAKTNAIWANMAELVEVYYTEVLETACPDKSYKPELWPVGTLEPGALVLPKAHDNVSDFAARRAAAIVSA